jgi:hypothetical protein
MVRARDAWNRPLSPSSATFPSGQPVWRPPRPLATFRDLRPAAGPPVEARTDPVTMHPPRPQQCLEPPA